MQRSSSRGIELAVKIVLLAEAQRRFEAEDEWWRENRDAKELLEVHSIWGGRRERGPKL